MKRFLISLCVVLSLLACEKIPEEPSSVTDNKKTTDLPTPTVQPTPPKKTKASRSVLDNGMTLVVMRQPSLPFVVVNMSFKAGCIYDPASKAGLASLTADLLTEGTKTRSSQDISLAIDFVGGSLGSSASVDFAGANLTVLKKDIEVGIELLSDIIINPVFDPEEVKRQREQVIASLIDEKDDPRMVAAKAINKLIYGDHPYRYPANGSLETVPNITRDDLVAYHRKYYLPNNALLVAVGDITETEARQLIDKYFKKWKRAPLSLPEITAPKPVKEKVGQLIDKELTQATIILGHVGIRRDNPDYYALKVMNYIMGGGGFASRLMTHVRDEQGLVYAIYSYFAAAGHAGSFKAVAQTKNENANKVIEAIVKEIQLMRTELVSADELKSAKDYLTGNFPLKLDTNAKVAGFLVDIENFNLGYDYFDKYPEYIKAVTRQKVLEVAEKYLHPDRYCLLVVANQEKAAVKTEGEIKLLKTGDEDLSEK
jgi:zinc protease